MLCGECGKIGEDGRCEDCGMLKSKDIQSAWGEAKGYLRSIGRRQAQLGYENVRI